MKYNPDKHHRRSIRLQGYDYSQPGAYFVTICTANRECLFGSVVDGDMRLNALGNIARQCWLAIPDHFRHARLDEFVIMPNHVHGIVWIVESPNDVGARHAVPLRTVPRYEIGKFGRPVPGCIPAIVRSYKSAVTKHINELRSSPGAPVWQRNYYEHIIRNDSSLNQIQKYILENPLRWHLDRENSAAVGKDTEWESWVKQ